MPTKDTSGIKEKMLSVLRQRGPSLPVHIAKGTDLSILFASAFLSELLSERKIKMSNMKVGSSSIYYIQGQENRLENFSQYLNSKEKEAFTILQHKKILEDSEQQPAIREALRAIKDFAIPFEKEEKIFWRYYLTPENQLEIKQPVPKTEQPKIDISKKEVPKPETPKIEIQKTEVPEKPKALDIFEKPRTVKKKTSKDSDKFFNKVKTFLSSKSVEILDIESFNKKELVLRTKKEDKEEILIVYDKKRISEEDILKAHKKISGKFTQYRILCLGEPLKRTKNIINAIKSLKGIDTMHEKE